MSVIIYTGLKTKEASMDKSEIRKQVILSYENGESPKAIYRPGNKTLPLSGHTTGLYPHRRALEEWDN